MTKRVIHVFMRDNNGDQKQPKNNPVVDKLI